NRGYTSHLISDHDRCHTCASKNFPQSSSERTPGKLRLVSNHHPHRDILEHVQDKKDLVQRLGRKSAGLLRSFFPAITDQGNSVVHSPLVSASLVRREISKSFETPLMPVGPRGNNHHHHYHVHTHHHHPNGVGKSKSQLTTPSVIGGLNTKAKKSGTVSKIGQSKGLISRTGNRPKVSKSEYKLKKNSVSSSTPGTAESLPRISTAATRKVTPPRKNTYNVNTEGKPSGQSSKSAKVVSSSKRKHSNGGRKITPPKRKMTVYRVKKITPPKKISNTSSLITSTNLPSQNLKGNNSIAIQTTNSLLPLPTLAGMGVPDTPIPPTKMSNKKSQSVSAKSAGKVKLSPVQNFITHSPPPPSNLKDRISESRAKKGFPYTHYDEDPPTVTAFPNRQDDVHIYIAPHTPLISKTCEDTDFDRPRRRWFENSHDFRARTAPNSPLTQKRSQSSR
ncbi:hypothetical protein FHG87_007188, partial [Trinorchestia longiramus]